MVKGKTIFTSSEYAKLIELVEELQRVDPSKQKRIRSKLRALGLYWSEVGSGKAYNRENVEELFKTGSLKIAEETASIPATEDNIPQAETGNTAPRVFISYKRKNKDIVFPIKEKIERELGEPCWIDLDGIESDAQFVDVIIKAIDQCDVFLFMYSNLHGKISNFNKDWTIRELQYAEKKNKKIVFLNLDQSALSDWFVFMFGQKQQVDIKSVNAFRRLLDDLREWLKPEKKGTKPNSALTDEATSTEGKNINLNSNDSYGTILISSTNNCKLEVDGIYIGDVKKDEYFPVNLSLGKHNLKFTSLESDVIKDMEYEVKDCSKSDVIQINFCVSLVDKIFGRGNKRSTKQVENDSDSENDANKKDVEFEDISFEISEKGDLKIIVSLVAHNPVRPYVAIFFKKPEDDDYTNVDGIKFNELYPSSKNILKTLNNLFSSNDEGGCIKKSDLMLKSGVINEYDIKLVLKNLYPQKIYDEYETKVKIYWKRKIFGKDEIRLIQ